MALIYYNDKCVECSDREHSMYNILWQRANIDTGSALMNLANAKKYSRFARHLGLPVFFDYRLERAYCNYIFCNDISQDRIREVLHNEIKKAMRRFGRAKR